MHNCGLHVTQFLKVSPQVQAHAYEQIDFFAKILSQDENTVFDQRHER